MQSLEPFALFLLKEGQLPTTVRTNLKLMKKILREAYPLTEKSANSYIDRLIIEGKQTIYIKQHVNVIRYWGKFNAVEHFIELPYPKLKIRNDFIPAIMTDEQVDAFINLKNPYRRKGIYWKRYEMWSCFWAICAYHGCRMGEAVKLRITPTKDFRGYIDFERNIIQFHGKTGGREVPLSFVVRDRLKHYIDQILDNEHLFPPIHKNKGPHVQTQAWEDDFKKRIKRLEQYFPGIGNIQNLRPYSLRHTAGTRWAEENWGLPKIQKALGQRKLDTTQKYLHMSQKGVKEMIDNDRLSMPYRKGVEIVKHYYEQLLSEEERYSEKVMLNIKKSKNYRKIIITIEAID